MWDDNGFRSGPVNEFDALQREDAISRSGSKSRLSCDFQELSRDNAKNGAEVSFFVGETITLKGRRFKVSHIVGGSAVILEPIGDLSLREGSGRRRGTNVVGRRRKKFSRN